MTDQKKKFQTLSNREDEEKYFYERDLELIRQRREALDQEREKRKVEKKKLECWMHCPKCGARLREEQRGMVVLDICVSCGGVFFDKGELELILKMEEKETFLDHVAGFLDRVFTSGFDVGEHKKDRPQ